MAVVVNSLKDVIKVIRKRAIDDIFMRICVYHGLGELFAGYAIYRRFSSRIDVSDNERIYGALGQNRNKIIP